MLLMLFRPHGASAPTGTLAPAGAGYTRPGLAVARPVQASASRPVAALLQARPSHPGDTTRPRGGNTTRH
jgi:hypothetical protein